MTRPPFWERPLDSFEDRILTCVRMTEPGVWYASLDKPSDRRLSVDFATGARSADEAVQLCAQKIRDDVRGVGKFAPHLDNLDLFYLRRYWSAKEALATDLQKRLASDIAERQAP